VSVISIARSAADLQSISLKRSFDVSTEAWWRADFSARRNEAAKERNRPRLRGVAADGEKNPLRLARIELHIIQGAPGRKPFRRRIKGQGCAPQLVIEAVIAQHDLIVTPHLLRSGAAAFAVCSTHFEQVGKIILEQDRQRQRDRTIAVVAQA
jgi:hypothetical protein